MSYSFRSLAILVAVSLPGCVFVEPKGTIAIDEECETAHQRYYVGLDSSPGEGLVFLDGALSPNIPTAIGNCGGDECVAALLGLARQFAAEAFVAGSFVVANNTASWLQKERGCSTEKEAPRALVIREENLDLYLAPAGGSPAGNAGEE